MPTTTNLLESIDESLQVKIYGKKINDFSVNNAKKSSLLATDNTTLILAKVYGAKLLGNCMKFQKPIIVILPDNGIKPVGCGEFENEDEYLMWVILKGKPFTTMSIETGPIEDIINQSEQLLVDIAEQEFKFHDIHFDGTKVSGVFRAKLRLHQKIKVGPISKDYYITVIDGEYPFSYNFVNGACYPLYTIGVASANVCFYTSPNRVCGIIDINVPLPSPFPNYHQRFDIACVSF